MIGCVVIGVVISVVVIGVVTQEVGRKVCVRTVRVRISDTVCPTRVAAVLVGVGVVIDVKGVLVETLHEV